MSFVAEESTRDSQHAEARQEDQQPLIGQLSELTTRDVAAPTNCKSALGNVTSRAFWWVWGSGSACIAVAALCTSISALCIKLMGGRIPAFEIVMVRGAFSWAATHTLGRAQHITPLYGSRQHFAVLAVRGVTGAVATFFTYEAYQRLLLSEAMTLYFIHPAITVLMAWLVLGERATWITVAGCGISLLGVAFIAKPPFLFGHSVHYTSQHWLGVGFAFASALNLAAALTAVRCIRKSESSLTVAVWFHGLSVVASVVPLGIGYPSRAVLPIAKDCLLLTVVSLLSFVNQIVLNRGFQLEVAVKASAVNYTQVFLAHLWGLCFLHEHETLTSITGSVLLLGGVVTVSSSKAKGVEPPSHDGQALAEQNDSKSSDLEMAEVAPDLGQSGPSSVAR